MKLGDIDLNLDPGDGNLNLRAYFASIVGPRRIVHGRRSVKQVPRKDSGQSVLLARNQVGDGGREALFVACFLPERPQQNGPDFPEQIGLFQFSDSEAMGDGSLFAEVFPITNFSFQAVLLPGDELYAAFSVVGGGYAIAPPSYPLMVSEVAF